jgi:hypothetical protein
MMKKEMKEKRQSVHMLSLKDDSQKLTHDPAAGLLSELSQMATARKAERSSFSQMDTCTAKSQGCVT